MAKKTKKTKKRVALPKEGVNLQARCKLCQLLKTHQPIWIELHHKVLNEVLSHKGVCAWLNSQIDVLNAQKAKGTPDYKKFNVVNFTTHFSKHVSSASQMKAGLLKAAGSTKTANHGFELGEQLVAEATKESDATALTYTEFPEIVENFEKQVVEEMQKVSSLTQGGRFRTREAVERMKLVQAVLDVKQGLARVQRSAALGGEAVRSATKILGLGVMAQTKEIGLEIQNHMKTHFPQGSFPEEMKELIEQRMYTYLQEQLPSVLDTVTKLYGIK